MFSAAVFWAGFRGLVIGPLPMCICSEHQPAWPRASSTSKHCSSAGPKGEIPKGTLAAMLASRQSITLHDDISKYETFIRSFFAEPSDLRDSVLGRFITENEQARSFFLSSQRRTACRRKVPTPLPVSAPFHALVSRFECIPRTSPKGRHQHFDEAVQKSLARCLDPDRPEDIFARIAASPVNERAS